MVFNYNTVKSVKRTVRRADPLATGCYIVEVNDDATHALTRTMRTLRDAEFYQSRMLQRPGVDCVAVLYR